MFPCQSVTAGGHGILQAVKGNSVEEQAGTCDLSSPFLEQQKDGVPTKHDLVGVTWAGLGNCELITI